MRKRLKDERPGITRRVTIGGVKFYFTINEFPDGRPAEIFIYVDKSGSELRVYDVLAIAISIGLQNGIPLESYISKMIHQRMEPDGFTDDPKYPLVFSFVDYLARWMSARYGIDVS